MRKFLVAAAAALVIAGFAPALASAAAAPQVHHARCSNTVAAGALACTMGFSVGRHPGDIHVVIRASVRQRVGALWSLSCVPDARGAITGRTTVRRHLVSQVNNDRWCRIRAKVVGFKGGLVTVVFSWVNR